MWTALINDAINNKADATPYVYVVVNKVVPQSLTLWNNGVAQYVGIPVNSGAPGADTTDGTFAVFEHVRYSEMKGTNVDGSTYDDPNVPYASYFNGGRRPARVHPLPLRDPAEQRLRRNELCQRRPGVAAHTDRDTRDGRGPGLRDGAAADDHDHHRAGTDDDRPAGHDATPGGAHDGRHTGALRTTGRRGGKGQPA